MNELESIIQELKSIRAEIRVFSGAALSRTQAAGYLGVSVRTLDELCRRGKLRRVSLTSDRGKWGRYVFRVQELDSFLKRNEGKMPDSSEAEAQRIFDEAMER